MARDRKDKSTINFLERMDIDIIDKDWNIPTEYSERDWNLRLKLQMGNVPFVVKQQSLYLF